MRSTLLINEPPLQVLPTLAKTIGLNEAIILQQIHYWLDPRLNKNICEEKHWVHNTFAQWEQQFTFWSIPTIKRIIGSLEEAGLLLSFSPRDFHRTKYYAINYDLLNSTYLQDTHACAEAHEGPSNICPKAPEHQVSRPLYQNDTIDSFKMISSKVSTCNYRSDQNDTIDRINLIPTHTENTTEITSENTLPPLTPPSSSDAQTKEKEEDEEKQNIIYFSSKPLTLPVEPYQQMVESWNHIVQNKIHPGTVVHLTHKRKQLLDHLLQTVFSGQIESWQDYCSLIANSRFLTGQNPNGFKVTLDWALVPDNAYKVLEGAIYDKPEVRNDLSKDLLWEEFERELARTLPSSPYLLPWLKISISLAKLIGQPKYKSWFLKVLLKELTPTLAVFEVEGRFIRDYIATHFTSELQKALHTHYPTVHHIEFKIVNSIGSNK